MHSIPLVSLRALTMWSSLDSLGAAGPAPGSTDSGGAPAQA